MAAVPVTIQCLVYPKNKTVAPYPATIVGYASITGLEVGGGPIYPEKPPGIPPDWEIWPNPPEGTAPIPEHPIVLPPDAPPVDPPTTPEKPHLGWNWSEAKSCWYLLYVPGEGQAQPKKK